jgi:hypothetical protein
LQIDSVDKKFVKIQYTVCGNSSQGAGTSGTGSDIAFSQLVVKGLKPRNVMIASMKPTMEKGIKMYVNNDTVEPPWSFFFALLRPSVSQTVPEHTHHPTV